MNIFKSFFISLRQLASSVQFPFNHSGGAVSFKKQKQKKTEVAKGGMRGSSSTYTVARQSQMATIHTVPCPLPRYPSWSPTAT